MTAYNNGQAKEAQAQKAKQEAERLAAEKKAENKKHREKINNGIRQALVDATKPYDTNENVLTKGQAKILVEAIAKGQIANLTINY